MQYLDKILVHDLSPNAGYLPRSQKAAINPSQWPDNINKGTSMNHVFC